MTPRVTVVSQRLLSHQKATFRYSHLFCHPLREVASTLINDRKEQNCQESPGLAMTYVCLCSLYCREGFFVETGLPVYGVLGNLALSCVAYGDVSCAGYTGQS